MRVIILCFAKSHRWGRDFVFLCAAHDRLAWCFRWCPALLPLGCTLAQVMANFTGQNLPGGNDVMFERISQNDAAVGAEAAERISEKWLHVDQSVLIRV